LLDLVAADLLDVRFLQAADIHVALCHLCDEDVVDLAKLEVVVGKQREFVSACSMRASEP